MTASSPLFLLLRRAAHDAAPAARVVAVAALWLTGAAQASGGLAADARAGTPAVLAATATVVTADAGRAAGGPAALIGQVAATLGRHAGGRAQGGPDAPASGPMREAAHGPADAPAPGGGLRINRWTLLGEERVSPLFRAVPGALRDMRERLLSGAAQMLHRKAEPASPSLAGTGAPPVAPPQTVTAAPAAAHADAEPSGPRLGLASRRGDPRPGWNMVADLGLSARTASSGTGAAVTAAAGPVATSAANRPEWSEAARRLRDAGGSGPAPQFTIGATYRYY